MRAGIEIHCLRDLTRGGLASALNEIAAASGVSMHLEEKLIPLREDVRAACEMLGLDPLHVANEGRLAAFVPAAQAERALAVMRNSPRAAARVWLAASRTEPGALVTMQNPLGASRIVDMLSGEQLPRIC